MLPIALSDVDITFTARTSDGTEIEISGHLDKAELDIDFEDVPDYELLPNMVIIPPAKHKRFSLGWTDNLKIRML
jgi:hypothetical protein